MKGRAKKPKRKAQAMVTDDLVNIMSGANTSRDKGAYGQFMSIARSYQELEQIFSGTAISRKIVEIIPQDMTREWRTFSDADLDDEKTKAFIKEEKRLSVKSKVFESLCLARLYGGALLVPIIENGDDDLSEPLVLDSIGKGELKGFTVVDASYTFPDKLVNQDPTSPMYLMPEYYSFTGMRAGHRVHHSRVIRFDGKKLPRREFQINRYWHQSVLASVYKELSNATTVSDSIAALMHELNIDIVSIKNLANVLATPDGEKIVQRRFETHTLAKSLHNMVVLDADEQFTSRAAPATGIDGLIDKFYGLLAAVVDIPATRFMGNAPGGLNATGESDMRNYYDSIKSQQETSLDPHMELIDEMVARSLWGDVPDGIKEYKWNPLWQESDAERATREFNNAQRDQIYLLNGVITEAHVAEQLMQDKVYSTIDEKHVKELQGAIDEGNNENEELLNATVNSLQLSGPDQTQPIPPEEKSE